MNEQFIKNIRVLKTAIAEQKLVVFAGAGISIDAGVPSWNVLIDELRSEMAIPSNETDFLRIAQMYYNERQLKELIDKVREVLKHKKLRYTEVHEQIFELNPEHIITTNFEDLLEQVIKSKAYPYSVIKKDSEFPYGKNTKLLVKIHGDLDEGNLVLKEDDYLEYAATHPLIESFIKGIFATKVVLFVGYSFSDVNLKIILQSVRNILGHNFQNAYMLTVEDEFHTAKRQYLKNKGINVINYSDAGKTNDQNFIEQYLLVGKNALSHQYSKRNNKLSKKGSRLLYLLKFISKYNDFAESIAKQNALLKMYKSLDRFSEVKVLPPKFLSNLYPFNSRKQFTYNYSNYVLGSNNEEVTKFFFEEFNGETNELNDNFFYHHSIPAYQKDEYQEKLNATLNKLNYSLIHYFGRSQKKIELFDYPKEFQESVPIKLLEKYCNCTSCLYNELNLKDFLSNIKKGSITETSDLKEDLLLAYSNYKAGNFSISFSQFEVIATKAWQLGKYLTYYIAQQNMKHLESPLNWHIDDINRENARKFADKIDDIDLDKLIFQIPDSGEDEYRFLKIIRDDKILSDAESKINEAYEKIVDVFEHYKKGGFQSGPYYPSWIEHELIKVFFFYTYNFIIKDEYDSFKKVFDKGIKALFISYATDANYGNKLRSFNLWIIKFIIIYGEYIELKKIIDRYEIKEIPIINDETDVLIRYLSNLLESFFTESSFMGRSVSIDSNISVQIQNFFFQQRLRIIVHNAFLIYARIKLPETHCKGLVRIFLDFLQIENILQFDAFDYLNGFLAQIKNYFSFEELMELLKISITKVYFIRSHPFFDLTAYAIKEYHPDTLIEDEELINEIIAKSINKKNHERGFMHLWPVVNEPIKRHISEAIRNDLDVHFESLDYLRACYLEIISPQHYYEKYISILEQNIPTDSNWEKIEPYPFSGRIYTFSNFVNMLYVKNLINATIPYTRFNDYPEYWKFFLKPFEYDFTCFDVKWLLAIRKKEVYIVLSKISQVKQALENYFKTDTNAELSAIYTSYFL